jgi:ABC-type lipoprotein release transport system permease subunit
MNPTVAHVGVANARARWRTYAAIAVLLGLTAGLALFSVAGARRTQSSYARYLRSVNASTMSIGLAGGYDESLTAAVAAFPEVERSATYVGFNVFVLRDGTPDFSKVFEGSGTFDDRYVAQDRFTPTHGRRFDPTRLDEVVLNERGAEQLGYHVGDHLDLGAYTNDQTADPAFLSHPPPPALRTRATVVGIGALPEEVLQDDGDRTPRLFLTRAYTYRAQSTVTYGLQGLVLRHGDPDIAAVRNRVNAANPSGDVEFRVTSVDTFHAKQATRPLAIALGLFGGIAAIAGLVLVAQALARAIRAERAQRATLRALGARPSEIVGASLVAPAIAVLAGVVLAVVLAFAASPLMPIGPVRRVEVARGLDVDVTVLLGGAVLMALVLLAALAVLAWREAPHRIEVGHQATRSRTPRVVNAVSSAGLAPSVVTGMRFALEPSDPVTAAPTRSVIAGAAIAIAALVGALTFGASLNALVDHPHLYGWTWDATVIAGNGYGNLPEAQARSVLAHDEHVAAWSSASFGFDTVNGGEVPLIGMAPGSRVAPTIVSGRFLGAPDEIVLGTATARQLHAGVGDRVTIGRGDERTTARVVGTAILPTIGMLHVAHTSLGVGAVVVPARLPNIGLDIQGRPATGLGPGAIFVRYRPGTDAGAELARLKRAMTPLADFAGIDVLEVQRPAEIVNSSSIGSAPVLLAAALVLGAMVSLALALAGSVRRRRRDLTVLKALGFTPTQLGATVSWHATITIGLGLVVGVPIGVVLGRVLWDQFAHQLDVLGRPAIPVLAVTAIAVGAIALGNVVAVLPARTARRVDPGRLRDAE